MKDEALAQPEQKPMHPEMRKMWEDYFDKCFREGLSPAHEQLAYLPPTPDFYAADTAIVQTLLPKLYSIIDRLLDGQDKALVIEARRVLPKTYKNSFEKGKT